MSKPQNPVASALFEKYCEDNRVEVIDYPYSSGHVHIPGPKERVDMNALFGDRIETKSIDAQEALDFVQRGYFVVRGAVSQDLIARTKKYIDDNYENFSRVSKRSDDWRCHFQLPLDESLLSDRIEHGSLLNVLLCSPDIMERVRALLRNAPSGIFYSQIALRTPLKKVKSPEHAESLNNGGSDYHIDGQANDAGDRFPDHWTLQVGICLTDQPSENAGNYTVWPGHHTSRNWEDYCSLKRSGSLPNLGQPTQICLAAGDVVFAHPLLPHRGGTADIMSLLFPLLTTFHLYERISLQVLSQNCT